MKEITQDRILPVFQFHAGQIPPYPRFAPVTLEMRAQIQPLFEELADGVSEYTFSNLYLFADRYHYQVSLLPGQDLIIRGTQPEGSRFFMTPCGMPEESILKELFADHDCWKEIPASAVDSNRECLAQWGIEISEDRNNYDYLYLRTDLAELSGKKYHKKRNLVHAFTNTYPCEVTPLTSKNAADAAAVLDRWREDKGGDGDYRAARTALEKMEVLGLSGSLYYVEGKPAGWCLGEYLAQGRMFAVHFEKGIDAYKGIYQFINQSFAASLPASVQYLNREQDLGDEGLRQAKMSYRPASFVQKYTGRLHH